MALGVFLGMTEEDSPYVHEEISTQISGCPPFPRWHRQHIYDLIDDIDANIAREIIPLAAWNLYFKCEAG